MYMDKYAISVRLSIGSFLAMIGLTSSLGLLPGELFKYDAMDLFLNTAGFVLAAFFIFPGLYLWLTGFKRYKNLLGHWGPKLILYWVFTIPYAIYLQFKYERDAKNI